MNISYNWLREYAPVQESPEELADILTMGGLEVESIDETGLSMDGVIIGRVERVRPHPNANRLSCCEVDLGGPEPARIVCGASNVAEGQLVPVATPGATLMLPDREDPDKHTPVAIRKTKLRGEPSEGMICAEDELGLSNNHDEIMVLTGAAGAEPRIGQPFSEYLEALGIAYRDAVLDISVTPNRPDATSHLGVARDAAALTNIPLRLPEAPAPEPGGEAADLVTVDIQAPEACPRYVAMIVRDVTVRESPAWLQAKLKAIGLRPHNHIVDVTNYLLHDVGQPLHAFDLDAIAGKHIRVHLTHEPTPFTTLDDKEHTIPPGAIMIADAERDVAIGGVMGGQNSEVRETTRNVLIESAFFDPSHVRRAAKTLGIQSDASWRFERGVDPTGQVRAAARAAALIAELGGGTVVPGMVDAHPAPSPLRHITVRAERIDRLLGVHIPLETTERLLQSIGFDIKREGKAGAFRLRCTVPPFRPDIEREVDVIEEIVRLYGYDNIPEAAQTASFSSGALHESPERRLRRTVRTLLACTGHREIYTNSMLRSETAEQFARSGGGAPDSVVRTLNPISSEMAALRPSLLPGALQVVAFNRNHGQRSMRFFEFGHVFRRTDGQDEHETVVENYAEYESFLLTLSGQATDTGWNTSARAFDLFDAKGTMEMLLQHVRLPDVRMAPIHTPAPGTSCGLDIFSGDTRIGSILEMATDLSGGNTPEEIVYTAELNWTEVVRLATPFLASTYRPVARHPAVDRDIALVVGHEEPAGTILQTIRRAGGRLLQQVRLFDLYEGEHVDPGKKSVAFALRFGANRTLTDREVNKRMARIVHALEKEHGASLRS
ncbi:MAG: phenylalanine--tRNA ligase subunit beta [Bacteroidetes bacterium SB0662_bin_6]|nr:phenylalanine--tRNA ligase subunit beta [Bacteroidetes bacterium SB0668_bin_1]MYE04333.1 phenylalanine--tRNA ligase subunit beta [Bacteroidetes bacterium SB0662_bin_6]